MTRKLWILGHPLSHSISPAFQQAALDHYSLDIRYEARPAEPDRLPGEVEELRGQGYLGANVTIPHKERVASLLDAADRSAVEVGAVNTIVKDGHNLIGYNTDVHGFVRGLSHDAPFEPAGKRVIIIGAGGAARAAVFGLVGEGCASLTLANRTLGRAQRLAEEARAVGVNAVAIPAEQAALARVLPEVDLIVNATSVGMSHGANEGQSPLSSELVPPASLVYDMVYNPPETPLLAGARQAGARTIGGLPMLIYQGAASFELWTGRKAPIEVMFRAAKQALAEVSAAG